LIKYSVIIPAYNAEKTIAACLESLLRQDTGGEEREVIVVDDGSSDGTAAIVRGYPSVRYIYQKNRGPAAARNNGVRSAAGDIVLFSDSDCDAARDWISQMVRPFSDPAIAGVKGAYRTRQKEWVAQIVQAEYEMKYEKMKKEKYIDFIDTYSAGFRRDLFLGSGGYDESFPGASVEDQEFSFRLYRRGCRMVFNPDAIVYHIHSAALTGYFRKKFNIGFWKISVLKRHYDKILRDSHTPQTLKLEMILVYAALFCLFFAGIFRGRELFRMAGALLSCFIALAIIEMRKVFAKNPSLGVFSIMVMFLRSVALGSGLLCGILAGNMRNSDK